MKKAFYLSLVAATWLFAACGDDQSKTREPEAKPQDRFTLDGAQVWLVESKQCNDQALAAKAEESYKIDRNYFVAVEQLVDSATELCKVGYVYSRNVVSTDQTGGGYSEQAILTPSGSKTTCWSKVDGQLVEKPAANMMTTATLGNQDFRLEAKSATDVTISLKGNKDCPQGTLRMKLKKR